MKKQRQQLFKLNAPHRDLAGQGEDNDHRCTQRFNQDADLSLTHLLLTTVLQLPLMMLLLRTTHTSQHCALFKRSERSVRQLASLHQHQCVCKRATLTGP